MEQEHKWEIAVNALRFYADPLSWEARGHPQIDAHDFAVMHDGGLVARETLEAIEE